MPTLFEKIIAGEIPGDFVYSDDRVVAIRDINPCAPLHLLIIPRKPIPTVNDLTVEDEPLVGHMFSVARRLAHEHGVKVAALTGSVEHAQRQKQQVAQLLPDVHPLLRRFQEHGGAERATIGALNLHPMQPQRDRDGQSGQGVT